MAFHGQFFHSGLIWGGSDLYADEKATLWLIGRTVSLEHLKSKPAGQMNNHPRSTDN